MSILTDNEIRNRVNAQDMISPFVAKQIRQVEGNPVISYGLSSFGYDARAGFEWQVFETLPTDNDYLDPKGLRRASGARLWVAENDQIILPPHSFALTYSVEHFIIPKDIIGICYAKSTYARLGVVLGVTPLEAGWRGHVTIELSNSTPNPVAVYAGEGIMQILFFKGEMPCEVSYEDRHGKYQNQSATIVESMV